MSLKEYPPEFLVRLLATIRESGPIRRIKLTQIVREAAEAGSDWTPFDAKLAEQRVVNAITDLCLEHIITAGPDGYYVQESVL